MEWDEKWDPSLPDGLRSGNLSSVTFIKLLIHVWIFMFIFSWTSKIITKRTYIKH